MNSFFSRHKTLIKFIYIKNNLLNITLNYFLYYQKVLNNQLFY